MDIQCHNCTLIILFIILYYSPSCLYLVYFTSYTYFQLHVIKSGRWRQVSGSLLQQLLFTFELFPLLWSASTAGRRRLDKLVVYFFTIIIVNWNITLLWPLWQRNVPVCGTIKEFWFWFWFVSSQWALVIPSEHFLCLSVTFKPCLPLIHLCSHLCPLYFGPDYIVCFHIQTLSIHTVILTQAAWINGANTATYRYKSVITTHHYSVTWYKVWLPQHMTPPIQNVRVHWVKWVPNLSVLR